jgi:hypothetical protein
MIEEKALNRAKPFSLFLRHGDILKGEQRQLKSFSLPKYLYLCGDTWDITPLKRSAAAHKDIQALLH